MSVFEEKILIIKKLLMYMQMEVGVGEWKCNFPALSGKIWQTNRPTNQLTDRPTIQPVGKPTDRYDMK